MKGIVFTEFIEFVEDSFGFEVSEDMIEGAELANDGVFTSVGTYDASEMVKMVLKLSELTKTDVPELLIAYGKHLFTRFTDMFPHFFPDDITIFDFLSKIDDYIHVEVKKLYPDAELPVIKTISKGDDKMVIEYHSSRKLSDFAKGLLLGAIDHFNENVEVVKMPVNEDGTVVKFVMTKQ